MGNQNTPRPLPDYKCPMAALYSGLNTAWDSQAEHEAQFAAENTIYVPGLSVTRKAAIQAAKVLPDGQARYADAESKRLELLEIHEETIDKWNSLDGYIVKAFKGAFYKPRIEEAGKGYYDKAFAKNWEYLDLLLEAGKTFITTHSGVLVSDGGMPAGFAAAYDAKKVIFDGLYGEYKDARQDAQEQTDVKINANNAIYKDGREMMEDGKHIFRKNASLRDRFVWERILELVTPPTDGGATLPQEFEGDLTGGASEVISIKTLPINAATPVLIEVSATPGPVTMRCGISAEGVPPVTTIDVAAPGGAVNTSAGAMGYNDTLSRPVLVIANVAGMTGHYKVTIG